MEATNIFSNKKQYFTSLPVNILGVDNSYQKPLSMAHVKKITKGFDPMGIGQIHVSIRKNGTYWVFDGQHRLAAYRELGLKKIDCIVYEGLLIEDESKGYVFYNNTMKQTQLQRFKAELLAGVPEAIEINKAIQKAGLEVDIDNGDVGTIKAIGAVRDIYKKSGDIRVRMVLSILNNSFGKNRQAYQAYIVKGVNEFIEEYGFNEKFDLKWLIKKYEKEGVSKLIQLTNDFHTAHGSSKKDAVKLASVKIYNHGKRKDNKLINI